MNREYPTSSAQDQVLHALNLTAATYPEAEEALSRLGIRVRPVREGRRSVAEITIDSTFLADAAAIAATDFSPLRALRVTNPDALEYRIASIAAHATPAPAVDVIAQVRADAAAEAQARRDEIAAAKAAKEARYQESLVLKSAGYAWRKIADLDTAEDDVWQLYSPAGDAVSVSQALAAIAAVKNA